MVGKIDTCEEKILRKYRDGLKDLEDDPVCSKCPVFLKVRDVFDQLVKTNGKGPIDLGNGRIINL